MILTPWLLQSVEYCCRGKCLQVKSADFHCCSNSYWQEQLFKIPAISFTLNHRRDKSLWVTILNYRCFYNSLVTFFAVFMYHANLMPYMHLNLQVWLQLLLRMSYTSMHNNIYYSKKTPSMSQTSQSTVQLKPLKIQTIMLLQKNSHIKH